MNRLRIAAVLIGLLTTAGLAKAQDFKLRFIGKGPCAPELQSEDSDFGLRLDKTQNLELIERRWDRSQVLLVIQYRDQSDGCGVIRDVIQITHFAGNKHFEFRCFDAEAPTDVVVGTIAGEYGNSRLMTAIDAWRIDLKEQKFAEVHHKVVCSADGWAGDDDGVDLVNEARIYAAHGKAGQFEAESGHSTTAGAGDAGGSDERAVPAKAPPVTPLARVTMDGKLIEGIQPKYPEEALKSRITGTVVLHVILGKDGTVKQVEVVSGHPLFAQAAVDAVRQWKSRATIVDGEPVEVDTIVDVTFSLDRAQNTNP